jgi:hypothetical protein
VNFEEIYPFIIPFAVYLGSAILLLMIRMIKQKKNDSFRAQIELLVLNGQETIFVAGLGVFDVMIFVLIAPNDLIIYLEETLQIPLLFYVFLYFILPVLILKLLVERNGNIIEDQFWKIFRERLVADHNRQNRIIPSLKFSTYVLSQVHLQQQRHQKQGNKIHYAKPAELTHQEEITLSAYPLDNNSKTELNSEDSIDKVVNTKSFEETTQNTKNYDPTTRDEEKYDPYAPFNEELLSWFPFLKSYVERDPVGLRPEFFLEIIVHKTMNDPQVYQSFKSQGI